MSRLTQYIDEIGVSALAERLDCSKQLVSHWRVGRQQPSPRMARRLHDVSGGAISVHELRPDIFGPAERAA